MRLAIIADVHAHNWPAYGTYDEQGINSRLKDTCKAMLWARDVAVDRGCDLLVVAGDLYHSRKSLDVAVASRIAAAVRDVSSSIETHLVAGNHDLSTLGRHASSLDIMVGLEGVKVFREPTVWNGVAYLPWTTDPKAVRKSMRQFARDGASVAVGHVGIDKVNIGRVDFEVPGHVPLKSIPKAAPPLWLGHYHIHKQVRSDPLVHYVGPLLHHTWGESHVKPGMVVHDTDDDSWDFVENKRSPRFKRIDLRTSSKAPKRPRDKHFVNVYVDTYDDVPASWLDHPNLRIFETPKDAPDVDTEDRTSYSAKAVLSDYMDAHPPGDDDVDRDTLIELGLALLSESEQ